MNGDKGAQINQKHCNKRTNPDHGYGLETNYTIHFFIFLLLYSCITGMIKNWHCV